MNANNPAKILQTFVEMLILMFSFGTWLLSGRKFKKYFMVKLSKF